MMSHLCPHSSTEVISINISKFFNLDTVSRIKDTASIRLSDHSYLPKATDPRSDWVASVAVPAFVAVAQAGITVDDFATIGTGSGLDALAAIEILKASSIIITDIHDDVVAIAKENITSNVINPSTVTIFSAAGDLLDPIENESLKLDLIYENLPNIPLIQGDEIDDGQNSSTFVSSRKEVTPGFVDRFLIKLHYLALKQAHPLLRNGGRVLSSIGGRIPLQVIRQLGVEAGYESDILTFTWKQQSEPEEVIGGYANWEREGFGPFRFYPVQALSETFQSFSDVAAGLQSAEIERVLLPHELTASAALDAWKSGQSIGHTVAVLQSIKRFKE
ncbi:50S ribosomal protein L11 methyltransferase [Methylobacterium currus]|uniref:50S ribosomal protein L11 methyltransferase n=1 Tax=Methylobacterium currus TaxID=2051553 RepID=UPI001E3C33E5|nr:50S ribosomal protein L11 methyltransferase [Methylobacterium currus]UHC17881.1 50S ribosomal protein L11 methyltransferase [Methylobacterium currus]